MMSIRGESVPLHSIHVNIRQVKLKAKVSLVRKLL